MLEKLNQLLDALDERTGIPSGVKHFLYEDIPASSGWHQVFGSVALFLIMIQFFTGILLAFNYAPTPGEAYNSLRYIVTEVTAGRIMRGLHHWGASMIIVIVVMHMVQVFLWGAYKKPREGTWVVGCILLLLTLAYGLTGYLLPWDNRAYWGTVVATQIGSTVPLMGPYVTRVLGSANGIGVVTFARFYAIHVLLLPPATMLLIGLHVFLVRKHGVVPMIGDDLKPRKKFYPEQVFKDTVAVFIAFAILFTMAIAVKVPLERLADPTDTSYIPRPEWYFLFLFQTLKVFEGPLEVVGTVILPTLAILALMLTPFIDRGKIIRVTRRFTAFGIVALAGLGWCGLTAAAIRGTPPQTEAALIDFAGPTEWMQLSPVELAGIDVYRKENCDACHTIGAPGGNKSGPDLLNISRKHDAAWMIDHFKHPANVVPGSSMPPIDLSTADANAVSALMLKLSPEVGNVVRNTPAFVIQAAALYQKNSCGSCHQVNGVGQSLGPPLNGLSQRRNEQWVMDHFNRPQALSPGSPMPPYKFAPKDMEAMVNWLFTLQ
jgi:quinol-cytochrome oxidoreductase complex cytochrome b subunit/cbb3-type cytochrome oxidase cytochrome c subunit